MRRSSLLPSFLAALSLLALAACSSKQDAAAGQMPPPEVGVVTLQPATIPLQRDLVGRLSAFRSADVRARVPGVLQRRVYEEGSDVCRGQVLFLIDPAPLQAALGQAKAEQATAQANYANARSAAERARKLIGQKFISQSDYDNAIAAERSAAAALQAGRAAVQAAEINLGYATVRSPIDGRAGRQQVTEGALVGQGDATLLTTVDQVDPLYVDFSVSADELASARAGTGGPIVVDLAGVPFLDSSALGALATANRDLEVAGRRLLLVAPQRNVRRVFELAQLSGVIPIHDTVDDALA